MKGEIQARRVATVLDHMAQLGRFTVAQLQKASALPRQSVRATVMVAEERGWAAVDGFGQRQQGSHDRGAVPVAYRWRGMGAAR